MNFIFGLKKKNMEADFESMQLCISWVCGR